MKEEGEVSALLSPVLIGVEVVNLGSLPAVGVVWWGLWETPVLLPPPG